MKVLSLKDLSITYDGNKEVVSQVSLDVEESQIISIVGESGSGKSTLIHGVLGLLPETASIVGGSIQLLGHELDKNQIKEVRGREAAIIFQDAGRYMNPIARVGTQYTEFIRSHEKRSKKECLALAEEMLHRVHLHDTDRILRAYPFELSGGMRQRVAIAMAMTLKPKILFADEPTSALDVTIQAQVVRQMMELREKYDTSIIMVTHNMGVAAYMSDYIGVMQNGRLVEWGSAVEITQHPREAYTKALLRAVPELGDERLAK